MNEFANVYRGRRVLVTGHTGFKGSWLVTWLNHLGAEVAGFSDRVPTTPAMFTALDLGGRTHHHLGDIRDASALPRCSTNFGRSLSSILQLRHSSSSRTTIL